MGLLGWLLGRSGADERGVDALAALLKLSAGELASLRPAYVEFQIPKRGGGMRTILAPEPQLKAAQRAILRRVLANHRCHPCATGFERARSIVSNARAHAGKAVVIRMDMKDFFTSTAAKRVEAYFRSSRWDKAAARLLTSLCTYNGSLPQGAPTSPRLSNLLNLGLDERLCRLAEELAATYTRYADDITYSLAEDRPGIVASLIHCTRTIAAEEGYTLHQRRKLHVRRRHNRQLVTGLVVNQKVQLPRERRRWLRAVEHHARTGQPTSLSPQQLQGWRALAEMVQRQQSQP